MSSSRAPFALPPGPAVAALAAALLALAVACGESGDPEPSAPTAADPTASTASGPDAAPAPAEPPPAVRVHRAHFEAIAASLLAGSNPYLGHAQLPGLQADSARAAQPPEERARAWGRYVLELLRVGEVDEAIAQVEAAYAWAERQPLSGPIALMLPRIRGLAYLRQAEQQNCVARHNAECCILPLQGGGQHVERPPAANARDAFLDCLARDPDQLDIIWLLNVAAMALGEHPGGLPERFRVPAEAFESEQEFPRFTDVADQLGVDAFDLCGGAFVEDLDGDGHLDLVTSSFDPRVPLRHHRGGPGLSFGPDVARETGLDDQLGGLNLFGNDYDGDGDIDLLVLRGAWLFDDGRIRNSLLRNDGEVFTDVTAELGLAEPARPTQAACFGDFDDDGDLDLFVGNESRVDSRTPGTSYPSQLFEQGDDGRFADVAAAAGTTNDRYAKGVTAGDYDNDGDLDVYVSNLTRNRLYRNDGGLRFTDVAPALRVTRPDGRSFAPWFFDWNHDGWLDLFVGAFQADVGDVCADHLGLPHDGAAAKLYENTGGRFLDMSFDVGLNHPWLPMGANFGDFDGDGWLDVYLATGDPDYQTLTPNVALRNDRGRRFKDITTAAGLGHVQKGHGVCFADFDHDGDQDLFNQLGGFYPGDAFRNALFENPGFGNAWVYLRLRGVTSNRTGVGARLRLVVETADGAERTIHRAVGSLSSFGGSPLRQEIGLGDAVALRRLEVWWPTSDTRQVFEDVPLGTLQLVVEGAGGLEELPLP